VVELAADGGSNEEIARVQFVTVHTVEAHLSHAYAKVGVRSRGQLARKAAAEATGPASASDEQPGHSEEGAP
jgi:DNA-binding CsgD family transcriptional regulator